MQKKQSKSLRGNINEIWKTWRDKSARRNIPMERIARKIYSKEVI